MHSILNNLNKEQKRIVFSEDNRIFVNAGPGTGKTHTIVAFVVNLVVNKHIPPHRIKILTFTKQTSSMMKKRLKKELGKEVSSKLKVSTFHSMAYVYMSKLGFLEGRKQANNEEFIKIAKSIARNKKCDLTPQELLNESFSIGRKASYNAKRSDSYKWFVKFYERLDENKLWEFDFLLNKMIEKFKMFASELSKQCKMYDYIIVDEYQDCNENQVELLKLFVGEHGNFLFVGDPDQMIYQWRGAKMAYSTNIEKHFKGVEIKNLTTNYRFGDKIGKAANSLISNNDNRLPKVLNIHKKSNGIVSHTHCVSDIEQLKKISRILKTARGSSVVLCYTNDLSKSMANFLKEKGFKVLVFNENTKHKIGKNDICVMTCHSSKGLEFDNVFFPYLVEYFCGNREADRRLFYVAITRAKQNLYLFSIDKFQSNGAYIRCKTSKFLKEIGF